MSVAILLSLLYLVAVIVVMREILHLLWRKADQQRRNDRLRARRSQSS